MDAGSHLAAITRILEKDFPLVAEPKEQKALPNPGDGSSYDDTLHQDSPSPRTVQVSPSDEGESSADTPESIEEPPPSITTLETGAFAGLPFPHASARANALHVVREHVSTYLITHPHLDHVSGFVINTAAFHNTSRPKRLAALPFTVEAIKTHLFNNILWPNLTDEDGGVGLVTFQRLAEGGNIALGEGSGRGYIEVCEGLGVRGFKVSHGHCMRGPGHIHRGSNAANFPETPGIQRATTHPHHDSYNSNISEGRDARSMSFSFQTQSTPGTPLYNASATDQGRRGSLAGGGAGVTLATPSQFEQCVIDSTAYFIRTEATSHTPCKEILIFGDVEPDSISLSPRTALVWAEAAPKIVHNFLTGIFIECSYTNSQGDAVLYGHLAPRHLLAELCNLGDMVREVRREGEEQRKGRKRKRGSLHAGGVDGPVRKASRTRGSLDDNEMMADFAGTSTPASGASATSASALSDRSAPAALSLAKTAKEDLGKAVLTSNLSEPPPLKGVKVVIIHVKDSLMDGPLIGDTILQELREGERLLGEQGRGLGCTFEISRSGDSYWF